MKFTLIETGDRTKLSEGRNYGFGSAFATVTENKIVTCYALTACADFMAEVVHAEYTGREWVKYGFAYKKQNIFEKTDYAYLVCGIIPINNGGKHAGYDQEVSALEANYKHIQKFINWFEDKLNIKNKTEITKLSDNRFLFKFDLFWTHGTYRISLYKFLQRAPLYFDGTQEPLVHLDELKTNEKYAWTSIKPKLLDMLSGFIPEQVMKFDDSCPHNLGIVTFEWPRPL
jgi:hypothetical protein